MNIDIFNGFFETVGGFLCWLNVKKLLKDKSVKGICWSTQAFFASWGIWNLFYYPCLEQWYSTLGAFLLATGNVTWAAMAWRYSRQK